MEEQRENRDNVDQIIPGIWIGRWEVALNGDWLESHKIQTVFNCSKQLPFHPSIPNQYRIPVDDNLQPAEIRNMETWAPEIAVKIMREYKAGHPMLIHCHAGMQRSTTACAFFLMALTGKAETIYLHCLPALHDLDTEFARAHPDACEVDDAVFEGPQSRVFEQAENRMHTIKALMVASI